MHRTVPFFIVLAILPAATWDQISPKAFPTIFPYVDSKAVWKLTSEINKQSRLNNSRRILNTWLDENWIKPKNVKFGTLTNKKSARYQALSFLQHRTTIKQYIRFLYREIQFQANGTARAEQARDLFYETDRQCINYFRCTLPAFMIKMKATTNYGGEYLPYASVIARTTFYHKSPATAKKMDWELKGGKMPGQGNFSQKEYDNVFDTQYNFLYQG